MASTLLYANLCKSLPLFLFFFLLLLPLLVNATPRRGMNVIDRCWRRDPRWAANRDRLAMCSVGFAGRMTKNRGRGLRRYVVTDNGDNPGRPRPGTLRYGATMFPGRVWITFSRDMHITLKRPLGVKSFTTIDGRGADVHIAHGAGFLLYQVKSVIIHGLQFHNIRAVKVAAGGDGDAIRLVKAAKVWIDHNTLYACKDGLIDVTRGSTGITISNNWFKDHDKVMLLGHDDDYLRDARMRVTVAFNRFGPNCNQRMPRIRHGYVHLVNNFYDGWKDYAIGGSGSPIIRSEGNLFVASSSGNKEATMRISGKSNRWNWRSVNDAFTNGAFFRQTGFSPANPRYNAQQRFAAASSRAVRSLTRNAGALRCNARAIC
ncbi:hypothetical protein Cni_G03539 [Canna indica]|uniref:Pectate lyase n=1 Tax=Canna indica TaxID=4628 RepID=A0AAQ3JRB4_9LILI|nr:hypothetical protein Cni_G03539 [Canna indica]